MTAHPPLPAGAVPAGRAVPAAATRQSRLDRRFAALREEDRAGLVTFITAGDPDADTSLALLRRLPGAGADVIELGMAFTDPMADGPAIQASSLRALKAGITLARTLDLVRRFRDGDAETPLVLMGYFNPIHSYGVGRFLADAGAAGVDGLIVVDLPPEEDAELCVPAVEAGLAFIRLATPTTDDARLPTVLNRASGFVYYVSIAGITGTAEIALAGVQMALTRLRLYTRLPVAVGFGIRTPEQAAAVARIADAVVIGSAIVDRIAGRLDPSGQALPGLVDAVAGQIADLAESVRAARRR